MKSLDYKTENRIIKKEKTNQLTIVLTIFLFHYSISLFLSLSSSFSFCTSSFCPPPLDIAVTVFTWNHYSFVLLYWWYINYYWFGGHLGALNSAVECLPSAQVMILDPEIESHIRLLVESLLIPLPMSLPLSLCLSWINIIF